MLGFTLDKFKRNIEADSFNQWQKVSITEFPTGVEVFFEVSHETCQDGSLYLQNEKSARGEGDREKNRDRAARRAKSQVRKRCKMIQADQMLTCTYRENMTDFDRLERDHKELIRRIRQHIPDFQYVTTVEPQERGALHLHIACQAVPFHMKAANGVKVKSANVIRAIWRSIVGQDNGTIHLTSPRRNASHRIACYISKYISKALEDAIFNKKSYWSSKGIPKPTVVKLWFDKSESTWDIYSMIVSEFFNKGFTDFSQYHNWFDSFYWLSFQKPRQQK